MACRVGYLIAAAALAIVPFPILAAGETEAALENPLDFDVPTIKRGRQFYTVHCVRCHGTDGRGDTEMREFLKTEPADLTDDQWLYGAGDAAVFDVVARGRTERDMPAFTGELDEESIWQVVHYLRYLGGRRP
jgi:cbb3-type cytochrome c oxidase subunit III